LRQGCAARCVRRCEQVIQLDVAEATGAPSLENRCLQTDAARLTLVARSWLTGKGSTRTNNDPPPGGRWESPLAGSQRSAVQKNRPVYAQDAPPDRMDQLCAS